MNKVIRKAITIFEDDTAITLVKPFSDEYRGFLFLIYEDAYGEIIGELKSINEIRERFESATENINEIISQL